MRTKKLRKPDNSWTVTGIKNFQWDSEDIPALQAYFISLHNSEIFWNGINIIKLHLVSSQNFFLRIFEFELQFKIANTNISDIKMI